MIERLEDLPAGVVGCRASGEVSAEDYERVLEPALHEAAESGEIRFLYVLEPGFEMSAGAMAHDAWTGISVAVGHHSAWKRTAVVTDADWIARAVRLFAWMTPGEAQVFGLDQLDAAREWVAG